MGSEAILPYSYGGTLGALNGASMDRRFFHRLGASQLDRTICSAAGEAGLKSVYGIKLGTEPEQFTHSKYIIAWASNIHGNNVHLWPFIAEARRKGAKLVVIDPYRTRTAACADWYLPINPGTDAALALGMMHVIIDEELHDADYLAGLHAGIRGAAREGQDIRRSAWRSGRELLPTTSRLAREYATKTGGDSAELRGAAVRERRHGDTRHHHAAVHYRSDGRKLAADCSFRPAGLLG